MPNMRKGRQSGGQPAVESPTVAQPPAQVVLECKFRAALPDTRQRWYNSMLLREAGSAVLALAMGAGIGVAAENYTDEVATGKVVTAQVCMETVPHATTITPALEKCFTDGVPGGDPIGKDKLPVGDPIAFVAPYEQKQAREARQIEWPRVVGWAVGGDIVHVLGAIAENYGQSS